LGFNKLFDTTDPASIQQAMDTYSEWEGHRGLVLGVTQNLYYEMAASEIEKKLKWLLPKGWFAWTFQPTLEEVVLEQVGAEPGVIHVVRNGTFTQRLNWFQRSVVRGFLKKLHNHETFPFSHVTKFQNVDDGPSKALFTLKNGGLDGDASKGWKIIGITLLKLG